MICSSIDQDIKDFIADITISVSAINKHFNDHHTKSVNKDIVYLKTFWGTLIDDLGFARVINPVNNKKIRTICKICPKLTRKTPQRRHLHKFGIFIANFEVIFWCFLCWLWATKCWLGRFLRHLTGRLFCFFWIVFLF